MIDVKIKIGTLELDKLTGKPLQIAIRERSSSLSPSQHRMMQKLARRFTRKLKNSGKIPVDTGLCR